MDEESVKRRWTNYIKSLYAEEERKGKPEIRKPMEGAMITTVEIKEAIDKMKKS